ncbi:MAG: ComF family protein [Bacteroidia bacterium]
MSWISDFAALIYPRVCVACGNNLFKHEELVCNLCYTSLPKTDFHLDTGNPVNKIFYGRAEVKMASGFLFFQKKGSVQKMLHALKYRAKPEVGILLGKWYGADLKKSGVYSQCDYIIPVPLHKNRQRKRGYNQSEYFAKGLSEELNIPVLNDVLLKKRFTETQTYKTREERWQNTIDSFELNNAEILAGKSILLVDDVITTGSTTEACVLQLQQAATGPVFVASIAYAL